MNGRHDGGGFMAAHESWGGGFMAARAAVSLDGPRPSLSWLLAGWLAG